MSEITVADSQVHTTEIVIAGVAMLQDEQGRYSLSALYVASKAGPHKRPQFWLKKESTQELINELDAEMSKNSFGVVKGGNDAGTFVHELLAVSYAGWISPKFQLRVNRAFLKSIRWHVETHGHFPRLRDPVCCECEQPMSPYDLTVPACQTSKLCLVCVTQYYEEATRLDQDKGSWLPDTGWKRWKTISKVVLPESKALYEQACIGSERAHQVEGEEYAVRYATGTLTKHEQEMLRDLRVCVPNGKTISGLVEYKKHLRLVDGWNGGRVLSKKDSVALTA